jgi:hypothetical protein
VEGTYIADAVDPFGRAGPSWLKQQLRCVLGVPHLRQIKLIVTVKDDPIISGDAWLEVDGMFNRDSLLELVKVEIRADYLIDTYDERRQILDQVASFFPRLEERKILENSWYPYYCWS